MSCIEPRDDREAIVLTFPSSQADVLRPLLAMVLDGIREELATQSDMAVREAARLRREESCWVGLLAALNGEEMLPSEEAQRVVREFAESSDAANDYARVVAEHDALSALLAQVAGRGS